MFIKEDDGTLNALGTTPDKPVAVVGSSAKCKCVGKKKCKCDTKMSKSEKFLFSERDVLAYNPIKATSLSKRELDYLASLADKTSDMSSFIKIKRDDILDNLLVAKGYLVKVDPQQDPVVSSSGRAIVSINKVKKPIPTK